MQHRTWPTEIHPVNKTWRCLALSQIFTLFHSVNVAAKEAEFPTPISPISS
jgi:hypothetical protein